MKIHHFFLFLFWLWLIIEIALLLLIWDNDKRGKFVRSGWHGRPFFILFCICFSRWLRSATLSSWSILYVDISSSNILISLLAHAKQIQPSDPPQVEMTRNLNTSCHPEDIKQGVNDECNISLSDHQWNESGIPETAAKQQYNLQQDTMHLFLIFQDAKCSSWKKRRSKLAKFEGKHLLGYIGVPQVNSYPWIV